MGHRLTNTEFVDKAILKHGSKYDYSLVSYINSKTKVKIICPTHGEFEQRPSDHTCGKGCQKCGFDLIKKIKSSSLKDFINKAKLVHGNSYDYTKVNYVASRIKIDIICPKHGIFHQTPNNHLRGKECLKCSYIKRATDKIKTNEEFICDCNKIHGNKYDYSLVDYKNAKSGVKISCPTHGEFEQIPSNHLNGYGCPICKESKGEKEIREYLVKNNFKFMRQHTFNDCKHKRKLPFDFYLPEHNTCIEFNGRQHYEIVEYFGGEDRLKSQQLRDKIKQRYCESNNILLLIVKRGESIVNKLTPIFFIGNSQLEVV